MPLKSGKSQETIGSNIGEIMSSYKKTGKIGTSKPKSEKAAQKQAAAIAYSKSKESSEEEMKESFDEKINRFLAKYLLEDISIGTSTSPNQPVDPNSPAAKELKKKKQLQVQRMQASVNTPITQREIDAANLGKM